MKWSFYLSLMVISTSWQLQAAALKFQRLGQLVKTVEASELSHLVPAVSVEVYEPHEQLPVQYRAYPMTALLDAVFGQDWRQSEELLFTCSDGYQPSIPVADFLKAKSFVAFERLGSPSFSLTNKLQANEKVELAPYYLVWDNLKNPVLKAEGASQWPYQIVAIDLVRFRDRFAGMAPRADAPQAVTRGFLHFRKSCTSCHRINGVGGEKSIELNYPLSVSEYFKAGFLARWIDKPQAVRWNSAMPPFNPEHPDRAQAIKDIVSYLEHMAAHKQAPPR